MIKKNNNHVYNKPSRPNMLKNNLNRDDKLQRDAQDRGANHRRQEAAFGEEDQRQGGEEDDPGHKAGQRLLADVESDGEHQPDRCGGEAANEALYRALMAHALIALEHREHEIARQLDGDDRAQRAEPARDHVADRGEIEVVLPRRHAAERIGVEELVETEDAVIDQAMLQQREHRAAIAEGQQVVSEDDEEELAEAHRFASSSGLPRSRTAPAKPPMTSITAGFICVMSSSRQATMAKTISSETRNSGLPSRIAEIQTMPRAAGSRVASIYSSTAPCAR